MVTSEDNGKRGTVYILTNESMPGHIKIGMVEGESPKDVETRMRALDNTGVPRPFDCVYAAVVPDARTVESTLHKVFGDRRVRPNREFFEGVEVFRVKAVLSLVAERDVTPGITIDTDEEGEAVQVKPPKRPPFRFSMVDIPNGTELAFLRDENITCKVLDDRHVEYKGRPKSLSPLTQELLNAPRSPAGPDYWLYEGETLSERRRRLEEERLENEDIEGD